MQGRGRGRLLYDLQNLKGTLSCALGKAAEPQLFGSDRFLADGIFADFYWPPDFFAGFFSSHGDVHDSLYPAPHAKQGGGKAVIMWMEMLG